MFNSPDTLLGLAEVAIALAGFSAIVVVLKRGEAGTWTRVDADRFIGMVIHAVFAVVFCFLPSLVNVIVQDAVTTLHITCALLGAQILVHSIGVMFFSTSNLIARLTLIFGILIGLIQFGAFTDWGINRELELYIVGVIWHIIQAGVLFVMLIWIPNESLEAESDD